MRAAYQGVKASLPTTQGENERKLYKGPLTPTTCHSSPRPYPGSSISKLGEPGPRKAPLCASFSLGVVTVAKGSTLILLANFGLGPTVCQGQSPKAQ